VSERWWGPTRPCSGRWVRELARAGSWSEASSAFRSVAGPLARAPVFLVEFAQVLRASGKPSEAFLLLDRLHGRGLSSRASLELYRDLAVEKELTKEAARAQKLLEERFKDDPGRSPRRRHPGPPRGQPRRGLEHASVLSGQFPEREDVEAARISVFLARKDYEGLLRPPRRAARPAPRWPLTWRPLSRSWAVPRRPKRLLVAPWRSGRSRASSWRTPTCCCRTEDGTGAHAL
jgi:hypothetical protein